MCTSDQRRAAKEKGNDKRREKNGNGRGKDCCGQDGSLVPGPELELELELEPEPETKLKHAGRMEQPKNIERNGDENGDEDERER